jgi:hypothetical protein
MSSTSAGVGRRRALVVALLGAVLGCVLLATVVISDLTAGPSGPPAGAAGVVPADALAYVHVSTDQGRPEVRRTLALLGRLPVPAAQLMPLGPRLALAAPWLGREAALAVLPEGTLTVLDTRDPAAARRTNFGNGTTLAVVGHYAVIGTPAVVAAAVSAAHHANLLGAAPFRRASAGEPADRVADVYVSAAGVTHLLLAHAGAPAMLGTLLARPTLLGATLSLSPATGGLRVHIHSAYDPNISGMSGPASRPFTPTLQSFIPAGATLMLDQRGLDRNATRLLVAASAAGVGGSIRPLLSQLGSALGAEGVSVPGVLRLFDGESAVALVPADGSGTDSSLLIMSRVSDEAAARATLAALETPLSQIFAGTAAGAGQTPIVNDVAVGADSIHELSLAPGFQLDYSVAHGLVIVSTSRAPVASVLRHGAALSGEGAYRSVLPMGSNGVSSLVFLDFNQLLNLVGQTGLTRGAHFAALRPDLQRIRAVGIRSTSGEDDSTAELFLQIP